MFLASLQLLTPSPLLVRVYALKATGVQPLDDTTSDPFLTLKLGKHKVNDQEHYVPETVEPEFYRCEGVALPRQLWAM